MTENEQILRELRKVNNQLNPGPSLLRFTAVLGAVLFFVFTAGMLLQVAAGSHRSKPFFSTKYGLFASPCYPPVGVRRDPSCK